jgi:hypothetical protein
MLFFWVVTLWIRRTVQNHITNIMMLFFWVVTLCGFVGRYQHVLHGQGQTETREQANNLACLQTDILKKIFNVYIVGVERN